MKYPQQKFGQPIALFTALVGIVLYAYLGTGDSHFFANLLGLGRREGDLPAYIQRFGASFVFLGVLPLVGALGGGYTFKDLGFRWSFEFLRSPAYWLIFLVIVGTSAMSASTPEIQGFYPFSRTLAGYARNDSALWFLVHGLSYVFLYYVPWEICFRGVLTWGALGTPDEVRSLPNSFPWIVPLFAQVVGSVLLHLPHPFSETLGAIVFGVLAGWLTITYRSFVPALVLHLFAGLTLDFVLIFGPSF